VTGSQGCKQTKSLGVAGLFADKFIVISKFGVDYRQQPEVLELA